MWMVKWYVDVLLTCSYRGGASQRNHHCECHGREANPWLPIDPKERRIGNAEQENIRQTLTNLAIFPFTRRLGMTIEDVHALVAGACIDAANPDLKAYFPL